MRQTLYFITMSLMILVSCSKDIGDINYSMSFPLIFTDSVVNISPQGATFVGHADYWGRENVITYGFVIASTKNPTIDSVRVEVESPPVVGKFSASLGNYIKPDVKYYVRAYAQTENQLVYGDVVEFKGRGSAPFVVETFSPNEGFDNSEVAISVSNLRLGPGIKVAIGNVNCTVLEASTTSIRIRIPFNDLSGPLPFKVVSDGQTITSSGKFNILAPRVTGVSRTSAYPGDTVIIDGEYFDKAATMSIGFGSLQWSYVKVLSSTKIEGVVPDPFTGLLPIYAISSNSNATKRVPFAGSFEVLASWRSLGRIHRSLGGPTSVALVNGEYYVIGLDRMSSYNANNNQWTDRSALAGAAPRDNGIAYEWAGNLYYGLGERAIFNQSYKDIYKYDPITNQWTFAMNAPFSERGNANCFSINNQVYIGFGIKRNNDGPTIRYNDFWKLNPATGAWTQVPTPVTNNSTEGLTSFVINGKAYFLESGNPKVWEFDPVNSTWTRKGDAPSFTSGGDVATVVGDKAIVVLNQRVYEYTPSWNRWRVRERAPGFRYHSAIFTANGKVYYAYNNAFNGMNDQGYFYEFTIPN